jgi:hypothetical protein
MATLKEKVQNRRYYLHRKLKTKYPVDGRNRTMDLPFDTLDQVPKEDQFYINELIKLQYNIQLNLF